MYFLEKQRHIAFWQRYIFFALTISLVLSFLAPALLGREATASHVLNIFTQASLVLAVLVVGHDKRTFTMAVLLGVPALMGSLDLLPAQTPEYVLISITAVYFTYITLMLLIQIFKNKRVDANTLMGAICVYFLLAVVWALFYALIETLTPGAFSQPVPVADVDTFLYYSLVTLTTLGFGDITPVSEPARAFSAMEAVVGQIYLTVIVARFIGLHMRG